QAERPQFAGTPCLIADCDLRIADRGLRVADCGSRIADCGLRFADRGLRFADRGSRIADRGSRVADRGSRVLRFSNLRVMDQPRRSCQMAHRSWFFEILWFLSVMGLSLWGKT